MFKNNKKGFSLIEMMIVIAVIAVLVSIIIPTIGNSSVKANAATNAANLRSVEGELTSLHLLGDVKFDFEDPTHTYRAKGGVIASLNNLPAPLAKAVGTIEADTEMWVRIMEDGTVKASYKGLGSDYFAYIAETGEIPDPDGYVTDPTDKLMLQTEQALNDLNTYVNGLDEGTKFLLNMAVGMFTGGQTIDQYLENVGDTVMDASGQFNSETAQNIIDLNNFINSWNGNEETPESSEGGDEEVPPTTESGNTGIC